MYSQSYREKLRHLQSVSHHFKQFIFSKKEKRCRMQSVKFKSYSVCTGFMAYIFFHTDL